mgnify:CR=1 FL=1
METALILFVFMLLLLLEQRIRALAEAQGHTVGVDGRVVVADANVEARMQTWLIVHDGLAWTMLDTRDMEDMDILLQADSPTTLPDTAAEARRRPRQASRL